MIKKILSSMVIVSGCFSIISAQVQQVNHAASFSTVTVKRIAPANVAGKWTMTVDANGQMLDIALELKQEGETFSGTLNSQLGAGTVEKGTISDNDVTATIKADVQGEAMEIALAGKLDGDKMTGTLSGTEISVLTFSAVKAKEDPK